MHIEKKHAKEVKKYFCMYTISKLKEVREQYRKEFRASTDPIHKENILRRIKELCEEIDPPTIKLSKTKTSKIKRNKQKTLDFYNVGLMKDYAKVRYVYYCHKSLLFDGECIECDLSYETARAIDRHHRRHDKALWRHGERIYNNTYRQKKKELTRLRGLFEAYGSLLFITFTFYNSTLNNYTETQIERRVRDFIKLNLFDKFYIGNYDYGGNKNRLHFHVIGVPTKTHMNYKSLVKAYKKSGLGDIIKVKKIDTVTALKNTSIYQASKPAQILSNHSIKDSTKIKAHNIIYAKCGLWNSIEEIGKNAIERDKDKSKNTNEEYLFTNLQIYLQTAREAEDYERHKNSFNERAKTG